MEQELFQGIDEIVDQVPAISNLGRLRRAARDTIGVQTAAVTRRDGHRGMGLQPRGDAVRRPIREEINDTMPLQVTDETAIAQAALVCPVIDTNHPRRIAGRQRRRTDQPEQGVGACRHSEGLGQPSARLAAEGEAHLCQRLLQGLAPACEGSGEVRETLSKDATGAGRGEATEAADLHDEKDASPTDRKIGKGAVIARMHPFRGATTQETARATAVHGKGEGHVAGREGAVRKAQGFQVGEELWDGHGVLRDERGRKRSSTPSILSSWSSRLRESLPPLTRCACAIRAFPASMHPGHFPFMSAIYSDDTKE